MPVKKQKECNCCCHHACKKIFMGIVLIIVAMVFLFTPDLKNAWMNAFFVVGVLFILKGICLSTK